LVQRLEQVNEKAIPPKLRKTPPPEKKS